MGSAHSDGDLAVLLEVAASRLRPGQEALDLGDVPARPARMGDTADFTVGVDARAFADVEAPRLLAGLVGWRGFWFCATGFHVFAAVVAGPG